MMSKLAKTTIVYLIRHGDVENPRRILYGRTFDVALSGKGKDSMVRMARSLAKNNINFVYSSPSLRTRQSAKILVDIVGLNKFMVVEELDEVCTPFDGVSLDKIEEIDGNVFQLPGEMIEDVRKRMSKFVLSCVERHKRKNVCLITHGDPMLICYLDFLGKNTLTIKDIRSKFGAKYPAYSSAIKMVFSDNTIVDSSYLTYEKSS